MEVDEIKIVIGDTCGNKLPVLIYRCANRYFLHEHCDTEQPLKEIDKEKAWDLLGISEELRKILRQQ